MSSAHYGHPDAYRLPPDKIAEKAASRFGRCTFLLLAFLALWATTEFIAWRLGYARTLGQPLAPGVYAPWDGAYWAYQLLNVQYGNAQLTAFIQSVFLQATLIFAVLAMIALLLSFWTYGYRLRTAPRPYDLEGSARFADPSDVDAIEKSLAGKLPRTADGKDPNPAVYIGAYVNPHAGKWFEGVLQRLFRAVPKGYQVIRWLRDASDRHIGLVGPTRTGKGVLIICTALWWLGSMVVNDPKGEIYELTAWFRRKILGHIVIKIDPTCVDGTAARFNPLAEVRIGTDYEVSDALGIATMLVDPHGQGLDTGGDHDHWRKAARALLTAFILHVLSCKEIIEKSLAGVDRLLSDSSTDDVVQTFERMRDYKHDPEFKRAWLDDQGHLTATNPAVRMQAADMLKRADKERESIISSAKAYLDIYRDPIAAMNTNESDFSLEDLMNADKPVDLYIINYPNRMDQLRPFTRLMLNMIVRYYTGKVEFNADGTQKPSYKHKLLLLIDEAVSTLGKMTILANSLAFLAGYGIKFFLVLQDLAQLADTYGEKGAQAFMANLHTVIFYSTNNFETAQHISRMLGDMTVREVSRSYDKGKLKDTSEHYKRRPLMTPEEVRSMNEDNAIIMVAGAHSILAKKLRYYKETAFQRCVRPASKVDADKSDVIAPAQQRRLSVIGKHTAAARHIEEYRRARAKRYEVDADELHRQNVENALKALAPKERAAMEQVQSVRDAWDRDDGIEEGELTEQAVAV